jgi:hypothetical protein
VKERSSTEPGVALTSTLHWFEADLLAREENVAGLAALNRGLVARAEGVDSSQWVALIIDSSETQVYGEQRRRSGLLDGEGQVERTAYTLRGRCDDDGVYPRRRARRHAPRRAADSSGTSS